MDAGWLGAVVGGGAVAAVGLLLPRKSCPCCSAPLPKVRFPSSLQQALAGGWVCKRCGTKLNRSGQPL